MSDLRVAKDLAIKLKHSSSFTSGDAGSFSIQIAKGEIELPGKYNPAAYLDSVGLKTLSGRVGVFFPGNGGLCVETIKRGAAQVYTVEPRLQNKKALQEICSITLLANDKTFLIEEHWSYIHEKFDTILWSEGLDQVGAPMAALLLLYLSLKEGGKLFVEVAHGEHKAPDNTGKINSWRPQEKVFVEALSKVCTDAPLRAMKGRLDRRVIYEITKPVKTVSVVDVPIVEDKPVIVENPPVAQAETPVAGNTNQVVAELLSDVPEKLKKVNIKRKRGK